MVWKSIKLAARRASVDAPGSIHAETHLGKLGWAATADCGAHRDNLKYVLSPASLLKPLRDMYSNVTRAVPSQIQWIPY